MHAANVSNYDFYNQLLHELVNIPKDKKKKVVPFLANKTLYTHQDTYLLKKIRVDGCVEVSDILPITIQHESVNTMQSG
ncbi:hypothetical protein CHS0354_032471, partial [Potamilus streckersoni]